MEIKIKIKINKNKNQSAIRVLGLKSCCVRSETEVCLNDLDARDTKGANPTVKKWRRGKGTKFTDNFRRSEFNWPGNRKELVIPLIARDTKWFKSP